MVQELHDVARTNEVDDRPIRERKDAFRSYEALTPPRVLTPDGECIAGSYRRDDLRAGALVGLAVFRRDRRGACTRHPRNGAGRSRTGRHPGHRLHRSVLDPTVVAVKGLVTEVGGLMTHGAVIAREYGLPAVVGAARPTSSIRDGQRIRVHGTEGYIEILS